MRTLALSLLLTTTAAAQPPVPPRPAPAASVPPPSPAGLAALALLNEAKPPAKGSVEEAILSALRQHPDIKLAEAKRQMAEAELEQARLQVAQRVAAAMAKWDHARASQAIAEEGYERLVAAGNGVAKVEVLAAAAQLQKAKAEVIATELELQAAKGGPPRNSGATADLPHEATVRRALTFLGQMQDANSGAGTARAAPVGSTADKLRAMLGRPIKLGLKSADLDEAMAAVLKAAGEPALTVKLPALGKAFLKSPPTVTHAGEMAFTAAVQFLLDEVNGQVETAAPQPLWGKYDVYVREYGLLVARAQDAPPGAPTLAEFARLVRAEKAEKK